MKQTIFYLLLIALTACDTSVRKYENTQLFDYTDFEQITQLTAQSTGLDTNEIMGVIDVRIVDSVIYCMKQFSDNVGHIYNLNTKQKTGTFMPRGRGPQEVVSVYTLGLSEDQKRCWGFDMGKQTLNIFQLDSCFNPSFKQAIKVKISGVTINYEQYNDTLYTCSTLNKAFQKICLYDTSGNYVRSMGAYPKLAGTPDENRLLAQIFKGPFCFSPTQKLFAAAHYFTDLITIYDLNGNIKTQLHGPDHFFPVYDISLGGDGDKERVKVLPDTRQAYTAIRCTKEGIWALYNKHHLNESQNKYQSKLFYFDWDGNPQGYYSLDTPVYTFDISRDEKIVIAVTSKDDQLVAYFIE